MAITVRDKPEWCVLELGGGSRPMVKPRCMGGKDLNVDVRMCHNDQNQQTVDFVTDFNNPLPIQTGEWDAVFSHYVLEHVSWRKVREFVREMFRVVKPGGKVVCVTANTEAQIVFCANHTEGWEGQETFESFSQILFGDNDYPENTHRNYLNYNIAQQLFESAGFVQVQTQPHGAVGTDMVIQGYRPAETVYKFGSETPERRDASVPTGRDFFVSRSTDAAQSVDAEKVQVKTFKHFAKRTYLRSDGGLVEEIDPFLHEDLKNDLPGVREVPGLTWGEGREPQAVQGPAPSEEATSPPTLSREEMFDRHYFGGGGKVGGYAREGYWDYPVHEITARHILSRRPGSVLELGCARGYILKRIQDSGVPAAGLEVSKHCYLTRVADGVKLTDLCSTPWPQAQGSVDLCYSVATMEHIPEQHLPAIIGEMVRTCKRGLHGVDFGHNDDGFDKTHCTLKPRDWWVRLFNKYAPGWPVEILDKEELERGTFPPEVAQGDGKVKLNVGSFTTMYHHGWLNIDVHDLGQWATNYGYKYLQHDVRGGLPFHTGGVDLIMICHMLEHLTYDEGLSFLRECRRVLKEDTGVMRIIVPDVEMISEMYETKELGDFDEVNEGCASSPTQMGKFWALTVPGHANGYDWESLSHQLREAGFGSVLARHRVSNSGREGGRQILRETLDMLPCLSLYVEATPDSD